MLPVRGRGQGKRVRGEYNLKKLNLEESLLPFVKEFQKTQWGMDWERTGLSQDLQKPITLGKYCFCVGNISMRITLKLSLWMSLGSSVLGRSSGA